MTTMLAPNRPHMKNHLSFDTTIPPVPTEEERVKHRPRHSARHITEETREMRSGGWVPGWDQVMSNAQRALQTQVEELVVVPPKRTRWQKYKDRFNALFDWFTLSALGVMFGTILAAGGILAAKGLIILFQEVLSGHIG